MMITLYLKGHYADEQKQQFVSQELTKALVKITKIPASISMLLSLNLKNGGYVSDITIRFCLAKSYFFGLKRLKHTKTIQKNAFFSKKGLQKAYLHGNINKHSEVLE